MKRFKIIYIFLGVFFVCLIGRLIFMQVFSADEAKKTVSGRLSLSEISYAPRGEITDRNGTVLAGNRQGYILRIKKGSEDDVATTVNNLCGILKISVEEMTQDMKEADFSYYNPYVLSDDTSVEIVTAIKESPEKFPCAELKERPIREYFYPESAVHILGRCGIISREEYKKNPSYRRDDYIGKQGAEKAFEEFLRGTDGKTALDKNGKTYDSDIAAINGKTIALTIDLPLQQAVEKALNDTIENTRGALSGAMVITDVNSAEILAIASYPAYNIKNFNKDYKKLLADSRKPMFNRAIAGLYEPGSTYKPITAIAALESGVILPDTVIKTLGKYDYYDRSFRCNIFRETKKTHGRINVSQALGVSCNYFFYELADKTGIDAIADVAKNFGLGTSCGIELSFEEAKGNIAHPKNRSTHWFAGDTLQAAIGQSDNRFTPVALANYAAALANGGNVYKSHILKSVDKTPTQKVLLNKVNFSADTIRAVHQGMVYVTTSGTAKGIFEDFPISVAGKTGSAQTGKKTNGLFIGFAPAQNPQLAFCAVIEGAPSGNTAASAVKSAISHYFNIQ